MTKKEIQLRHGTFEGEKQWRTVRQVGHIRAGDYKGDPAVNLRLITYNTVDDYGSVWLPGCLEEGIGQRLPQMCRNHDRGIVIGRAIEDTYEENSDGPHMWFRFANFARVPDANEVHSLLEDEILDECSIGFRWGYEWRDPTESDQARWPGVYEIITKAFVSEVSIVVEGAVPGAKAIGMREKPAQRSDKEVDLFKSISENLLSVSRALNELAGERALAVKTAETEPTEDELKVDGPGDDDEEEKEAAIALANQEIEDARAMASAIVRGW